MKASLFLMTLCFAAVAGDGMFPLVPPPPGLEWLTPALVESLEQWPVIGSYVVITFQWVGFIAAAFTAVTVFVSAVLQGARAFAWALRLQVVADKLNVLHRKLWPYLAYLSIFNAPSRKLDLRDAFPKRPRL